MPESGCAGINHRSPAQAACKAGPCRLFAALADDRQPVPKQLAAQSRLHVSGWHVSLHGPDSHGTVPPRGQAQALSDAPGCTLQLHSLSPATCASLGVSDSRQYLQWLHQAAMGQGSTPTAVGFTLAGLVTSSAQEASSYQLQPPLQTYSTAPWPGLPGSTGMRFSMHLQPGPTQKQRLLVIDHEPILPSPSHPLSAPTTQQPVASYLQHSQLATIRTALDVQRADSGQPDTAGQTADIAKRALLVAEETPWIITLICIQVG